MACSDVIFPVCLAFKISMRSFEPIWLSCTQKKFFVPVCFNSEFEAVRAYEIPETKINVSVQEGLDSAKEIQTISAIRNNKVKICLDGRTKHLTLKDDRKY